MAAFLKLTEGEWKDHLERLTCYALERFWKQGWARNQGDSVHWCAPGGCGPEDIACEAVLLVLSGKRKYDPATEPDFPLFLRNVVDSLISHLRKKVMFEKTGHFPLVRDRETGEWVEVELAGPEEPPPEMDQTPALLDVIKKIVFAGPVQDPLMHGLICCLEQGMDRPAEMARFLKVSVPDVNKAQQRLRYRLQKALGLRKERRR